MTFFALLVITPARAASSIRDHSGQRLQFEVAPKRIMSFLPAATECICALGACARLVAVDKYSNVPDAVLGLPRLADLNGLQIEAIVALRPDLVIVSSAHLAVERLRALGVPVWVINISTHDDVRAFLDDLGAVLGAEAPRRATSVWLEMERRTEVAAKSVPVSHQGTRVYVEVDRSPYAAGEESYIGELLKRLGARNIVPRKLKLGPFPRLSPEFVVRAQPELIVIGATSAPDLLQRPGWGAIPAIQQRRICALKAAEMELIVRPGPRMGEAAEVLARCLGRLSAAPA
jgi:iron complex transport system substrate-binding protein